MFYPSPWVIVAVTGILFPNHFLEIANSCRERPLAGSINKLFFSHWYLNEAGVDISTFISKRHSCSSIGKYIFILVLLFSFVCPIRHWYEGFNSWTFSSFLGVPRCSKPHNIRMTDFSLVPVCLSDGSILTVRSAASSHLSERNDLYWNLRGFFLLAVHHFPVLVHHHQSSFLVTWIKRSLFTFSLQYNIHSRSFW